MARSDLYGFFWDDIPPPKPPKREAVKRTPPPPVWLYDTYLPYLDEALAFDVDLFTQVDLLESLKNKEPLVFDIECYPNYFLIAFKSVKTRKVAYFEITQTQKLERDWLIWILENFLIISFNGNNYDIPLIKICLVKPNTIILKQATDDIIVNNMRPFDVVQQFKTKKLSVNHIDLIEVAPLSASLKMYSGRLHCRRMQDLPFHPNKVLNAEQIAITRLYCINDLDNTIELYFKLLDDIKIREDIGSRYNIDVRSKSDPQVAETVIANELGITYEIRDRFLNCFNQTQFKYDVPHFIQFSSPLLQHVLQIIKNETYTLNGAGKVQLPESISKLDININGTCYQMGNGGLHSKDSSITYVSDFDYILKDRDVVSYYPMIVIILGLYPYQLGKRFLKIFSSYVYERIEAKNNGDKKRAGMLKIFINGIFGKFGSVFSIMYSPKLLIQVTITGQLCLLMLIERLELAGFRVLSGNTDGVVIHCKRNLEKQLDEVILNWEQCTGFTTEETVYSSLHCRDVNNYIAVKPDGTTKNKGAYRVADLSKNPTNEICVIALNNFLSKNIPISETICNCTDITKFLTIRDVKGGGVKVWSSDNIEYLGKSVRWYYSHEVSGEIIYAKSGNKVARSENARPLMQLIDKIPEDLNFDWYINEAEEMLSNLGYNKG